MLTAPARLLRLLMLLQARSLWTGRGLAERLETTERTLRRDVERLRSLGYEVHSSSGVEGGYRLGTSTKLPPLALEDDEAIAIALGLATSPGTGVSGIADAAMRAAAKLERLLPHGLRQRLTAVRASIVPLQGGVSVVGMGIVSIAAEACVARRELQFFYRDHSGTESVRTVEPHGLVYSEAKWYLVAWDKEREAWRTFRLDRASSLLTTQRHFGWRQLPEEGIAAYVSRGLAVAPYRFRACIIVHAPAETVRETMSLAAGVVEPIDSLPSRDRSKLARRAGCLARLPVRRLRSRGAARAGGPPEACCQTPRARRVACDVTRCRRAAEDRRHRRPIGSDVADPLVKTGHSSSVALLFRRTQHRQESDATPASVFRRFAFECRTLIGWAAALSKTDF